MSKADIHRATVRKLFGLTDEQIDALPKEVYEEKRIAAKTVNFGYLYGASKETIVKQIKEIGDIDLNDGLRQAHCAFIEEQAAFPDERAQDSTDKGGQILMPRLKLVFKKPTAGYWDGGVKDGGEFTPDTTVHPGAGQTIRWGDIMLNYWFNCGSGRSWKEALSIAKRRLYHLSRVEVTIESVM